MYIYICICIYFSMYLVLATSPLVASLRFHPPWRRFALATVAHRTGDLIGRHSSSHSPHKSGSDPPGNTAGKIPQISHTASVGWFYSLGSLRKYRGEVMGKKRRFRYQRPMDRPCHFACLMQLVACNLLPASESLRFSETPKFLAKSGVPGRHKLH